MLEGPSREGSRVRVVAWIMAVLVVKRWEGRAEERKQSNPHLVCGCLAQPLREAAQLQVGQAEGDIKQIQLG